MCVRVCVRVCVEMRLCFIDGECCSQYTELAASTRLRCTVYCQSALYISLIKRFHSECRGGGFQNDSNSAIPLLFWVPEIPARNSTLSCARTHTHTHTVRWKVGGNPMTGVHVAGLFSLLVVSGSCSSGLCKNSLSTLTSSAGAPSCRAEPGSSLSEKENKQR